MDGGGKIAKQKLLRKIAPEVFLKSVSDLTIVGFVEMSLLDPKQPQVIKWQAVWMILLVIDQWSLFNHEL